MRWRALVVVATAGLVVLVTGGPAMAKGADQVTLSGPGLTRPVVVDASSTGGGEPGSGGRLATLSEDSGLFLAMFGPDSVPDSTQRLTGEQPDGVLGPRYRLVYRVPDGNSTPPTVTQDLYPSAAGGPVTYTRPGQPVFGTTTTGGWYRPPAGFAALLVALGVPGVTTPAAAPTAEPAATAPATTGQGTTGQGGVGQGATGQGATGQGKATGTGTAGSPAHTGYWISLAAVVLAVCAAFALLTYRARARLRRTEGSPTEDSPTEDSTTAGNTTQGSSAVNAGTRAVSGE